MDGWKVDGWMEGWLDGRKGGWMDVDRRLIVQLCVCDRLLDVCVRVVSVSSHLHWMHESVFLLYYKPNSIRVRAILFSVDFFESI